MPPVLGARKMALQELADETGLRITVSHFPPGTSKWNKIEHRMFCHISQNWRGHPLLTHDVVVNLIANTTTRTGLTIKARLDKRSYPTGIEVADADFDALNIKLAQFHGDWNYVLAQMDQPRKSIFERSLALLIQKGSRPSVFTGMCTRRSHRSRSVTQGASG